MNMERAWTEKKFFQVFNDNGSLSEISIPWYMFGNFVGLLGINLPGWNYWISWQLTIILNVAFLLIWNFIPQAFRLSPLNKINNRDGKVGGSRYYLGSYGSVDLLRQVVALPKKDQRLFPDGLIQTLSKDLYPAEREKINKSIKETLDKIDERNKYLKDVEQKSIPTEHVLAALADAKSNVESDIEVYKEFL